MILFIIILLILLLLINLTIIYFNFLKLKTFFLTLNTFQKFLLILVIILFNFFSFVIFILIINLIRFNLSLNNLNLKILSLLQIGATQLNHLDEVFTLRRLRKRPLTEAELLKIKQLEKEETIILNNAINLRKKFSVLNNKNISKTDQLIEEILILQEMILMIRPLLSEAGLEQIYLHVSVNFKNQLQSTKLINFQPKEELQQLSYNELSKLKAQLEYLVNILVRYKKREQQSRYYY